MAKYTQDRRRITLETPLGKDALMLRSFHGTEEMSRLFTYDLDMLSEKDAIAAKDIVGKNVTFWVEFADETPRYFNGFVSRFTSVGRGDRLSLYRAQVVPWLWFLTRTSDCRIFQNKSVPDIVKKIFGDLGFNDFETSEIKGQHQPWEYCVQYRETDFNFISRLLEHEGIFYYFKHENGKHTLVLSDQKGAYKDCKEKEVEFRDKLSEIEIFDHLSAWEHHYEYRSGKWSQTDYNFETATTNLKTETNSLVKLDNNSKYEFYDFPGEYEKKADGDADLKIRMEEEETRYDTIHGEGTCRSFTPGGKFKLVAHHSAAEKGKGHVVTSVRHSASVGATYVSNTTGDTGGYENHFTCIPDTVTFRPARITPKPIVSGVQTAVVVGPQGEEIYTDKYGRVKVQFYWDREGKKDDKSSCWIRVAQSMAGRKWGAMFIPRIGQEVVIEFLEGDPDRPLIVGTVYNSDQMPHYDLPAEQTKSYLKTNSSKGGDGFNEIRFEDKKGKEQIFMHAERNMDVRVKNDSLNRTIGNRHQIIGDEKDGSKTGDQRELVYQDKHLNIKRHQIEHIEGNMKLLIGKGEASDGGNLDLVTEKDSKTKIGGACHLDITGDRAEKVGGAQSLTVSGNQQEKVGMNHALEAGMEVHIKAGMTCIIEAGVQLSLKVGGSFVDISPVGVCITGPMVMINSGGAAGSGSGSSPSSPAAAAEASPTKPDMADDSKTGQKSSS